LTEADALRATYDAQLKKMLAYIAAEISSLLMQFQIFLNLAGRHPWERLSPIQVSFLEAWMVALWVVGIAVSVAIVAKFHELVFLESKLGVWRFYHEFRSKRSHIAEGWDKLFQLVLGTKDEDMKGDKLWDDPKRVRRMKYAIDAVMVVCIILSLVLLSMNLLLLVLV
jgi:hypothetical protein